MKHLNVSEGEEKMDYEINEGTLAVVSLGSSKSKIYEDKKEYIVDSTPFEIIDYSCKYFGSSYEGRKEGTKSILHIDYKVPIIIEGTNNLIFFPTSSPYLRASRLDLILRNRKKEKNS